MIARHEGAIVFVAGAIPGEVVEAEVEKVQRGTGWAITRTVIERSPDRVPDAADGTSPSDGGCGGCVFAHIAYERQRAIKAAIIDDAFRRLGRITLEAPVDVVASPVDGYRMRARLHVRNGRIGFFREGTHSLCEAGPTRQLRPDTLAVLQALEQSLKSLGRDTVGEIELSENVAATERALHLELLPNADPSRLAAATTLAGLTGATCAPPDIDADDGPVGLGGRVGRGGRRPAVAPRAIVLPGQSLPAATAGRARAVAGQRRAGARPLCRRRACSVSPRLTPGTGRSSRSRAITSRPPICAATPRGAMT